MTHRITKGTIIVVCIVLAIIFTSLAFPRYEREHWYRQIIVTIMSPPQKAATGAGGFFSNLWNYYINLSNTAKENEALKVKLAEAEQKIIELEEIKNENTRLHEMLNMLASLKAKGIGASVIASDVLAEFKTVIINKGANEGIKKNMVVIGPGGLVGRIGQVAASESTVLLISDPNSSVDVYMHNGDTRALLVGTARSVSVRPFFSLTRLEYLKKSSGVKEDDVVITSGLDRVFPAGIPVGTITKVENADGVFNGAEVVPFVDLAEIHEVTVILK